MSITAKQGAAYERELIPAGNHIARCYKMIEIGTVPEEYLGQVKKQHKVRIGWELPLELRVFNEEKGEQPFVIDKEYTLSLGEKATLRADLQSWRGKAFTEEEAQGFDITKLLGVPCMLNIIHVPGKTDPTKTFQRIASITPLPKGMECPDRINGVFIFELENFDLQKYNELPDFIKEKIAQSEQYKAMTHPTPDANDFAEVPAGSEEHDDMPF
jgi:hypothetical protein